MANGLASKSIPPDTAEASHTSLSSDIVEVLVFTSNDAFLQTLRDAVGAARRLWHVPSADKVSDLLVAGQVGILVLDAPSLQEAASVFVAQIKRQFPDLVVVVAGTRTDETALVGLISAGSVYRFIHKPMSPGRAKSFVEAAVKRYEEHRRRVAEATGANAPGSLRAVRKRHVLGALAGLVALAVIVGAWRHGATERSRERSRERPAVSAASADPPVATRAIEAKTGDHSSAGAETDVLEKRLNEAAVTVDAARKAGIESNRIASLASQLAESREQSKTAGHLRPTIEARPDNARDTPQGMSAAIQPAGASSDTPAEPLRPRHSEPAPDPGAAEGSAPLLGGTVAAAGGSVTAAGGTVAAVGSAVDAARSAVAVAEGSGAAPSPSGAAKPSDSVIDTRGLVLVRSVRPAYPAEAARAGKVGWVELDFTIDDTGKPKDIAVHAATPPGLFDAAAIGALSKWRYKPVLRDGHPAASRARIRMRFVSN